MVKTHIINPSTGRRVKIGTPTYYKVIKNTTMINPLTGRRKNRKCDTSQIYEIKEEC
jgi:hypothetical protein